MSSPPGRPIRPTATATWPTSTTTTAAATATSAVAATAATTAAAFGAAAESAIEAFRSRLRFVDNEVATLELAIVQLLDRCLGHLWRSHLHETEPTRSPRDPVRDDVTRHHLTDLPEEVFKVFAGYVV
jgi:hypothetical protein